MLAHPQMQGENLRLISEFQGGFTKISNEKRHLFSRNYALVFD